MFVPRVIQGSVQPESFYNVWRYTIHVLTLQAFSKPEVQSAIMDCTQNPMNVIKYQSNPEVMMVSHQPA